MQQLIGVRRNLQAISKQERQQYFWCLKMLGILPPFQALKDRYFWTLGTEGPNTQKPYNHMKPSCLHDQLIAAHGTCCQHSSFFFAYYHRHLMFHFQMRLNFVDQVLRMSHEQFAERFPDLFGKNVELWKSVLAEYKQLVPKKKKVMAHYWNPTNFNNRDDLVIPIELADPEVFFHELDKVDELHKIVRGSYPYEINVGTRWYNEPSKMGQELDKFIEEMVDNQYFYLQQFDYQQLQKEMVKGNYNPRQNNSLSDFVDKYIEMTCFKKGEYPSTIKSTAGRNYKKFKATQKMNTFNQDQGEILITCGGRLDSKGKPHNMHFFNSSQIENGGRDRSHMLDYNKMLPHYQLAYALFNDQYKSLTDYLKPTGSSIENPHNTIHTNMHFSMVDGSFSLLNLMFFPYHSWIDIQLEMKIRMCHHTKEAHKMYQVLNSNTFRRQNFQALLNPKGKPRLFGTYPLLEWVDPKFILYVLDNRENDIQSQLQAAKQIGLSQNSFKQAFPFQEMCLRSPNQLRTSLYLQEFYEQSYKPQHSYLFAQFKGFKEYNCSYDYQIFQTVYDEQTKTVSNLTYPLGDYPQVNIPSYLKAMRHQVNIYHQHLNLQIAKAISNHNLPEHPNLYKKIVQKNILLLIKYRASIPNRTYVFRANYSQLGEVLRERGVKMTEKEEAEMRQERPLLILPFFGKSKDSSKCINCGNHKYRVINLCEQIFERHPKIWGSLNRALLSEVVYDSSCPSGSEGKASIQSLLKLSFLEQQFMLRYVNGAQQVVLNLIVSFNFQHNDDFQLRLTLDTNRLQSHQPINKIVKSIQLQDLVRPSNLQQPLTYTFDFYKCVDNPSDLKRNDLDDVVYTWVSGDVYLDGATHYFSYPIKEYHEIIRYSISIEKDGDQVSVRIVDTDLELKSGIYSVG